MRRTLRPSARALTFCAFAESADSAGLLGAVGILAATLLCATIVAFVRPAWLRKCDFVSPFRRVSRRDASVQRAASAVGGVWTVGTLVLICLSAAMLSYSLATQTRVDWNVLHPSTMRSADESRQQKIYFDSGIVIALYLRGVRGIDNETLSCAQVHERLSLLSEHMYQFDARARTTEQVLYSVQSDCALQLSFKIQALSHSSDLHAGEWENGLGPSSAFVVHMENISAAAIATQVAFFPSQQYMTCSVETTSKSKAIVFPSTFGSYDGEQRKLGGDLTKPTHISVSCAANLLALLHLLHIRCQFALERVVYGEVSPSTRIFFNPSTTFLVQGMGVSIGDTIPVGTPILPGEGVALQYDLSQGTSRADNAMFKVSHIAATQHTCLGKWNRFTSTTLWARSLCCKRSSLAWCLALASAFFFSISL